MKNGKKPKKTESEIISFQLEKDVLGQVRQESFDRRIPVSMWLREAAREKLTAQKRRRPAASGEAVLA